MSSKSNPSQDNHPLTLRVMRLSKPTFVAHQRFAVEKDDLAAEQLLELDSKTFGCVAPHLGACSDLLLLPQALGNVYLGETFVCYVCLENDSQETLEGVTLKTHVQTSTRKINIANSFDDRPARSVRAGEVIGEVLSHEVNEIDQHMLVCSVTYVIGAGEQRFFRKFFKFTVVKPLDLRTKFYNADTDDVYLEAQVQNVAELPIIMERISLQPSSDYVAMSFNLVEPGVFTSASFNPGTSRQYLYCLKANFSQGPKVDHGVAFVGKLDMMWRTVMGERGRLQTSQLQRMIAGYGDLRLLVKRVPSVVKLFSPFEIVCTLQNCCDRPLQLTVTFDNKLQPGLIWDSTSGSKLEEMTANQIVELCLSVIPTKLGLQSLSGIRLCDAVSKRLYECDEIAQVFVY